MTSRIGLGIAISSLLVTAACVALGYKVYGVDTNNVSRETLEQIDLIGFERTTKDKSFAMCETNPESDYPACMCTPYSEFIRMRDELNACREANR